MKIKIDDNLADTITVDNLLKSYIIVSSSIASGRYTCEDDLAEWNELLPAIKVVASWYCVDFKAELKKAKAKL